MQITPVIVADSKPRQHPTAKRIVQQIRVAAHAQANSNFDDSSAAPYARVKSVEWLQHFGQVLGDGDH